MHPLLMRYKEVSTRTNESETSIRKKIEQKLFPKPIIKSINFILFDARDIDIYLGLPIYNHKLNLPDRIKYKELTVLCQVSKKTIIRRIEKNKFPHPVVNKHNQVLFNTQDILDWIDSFKVD